MYHLERIFVEEIVRVLMPVLLHNIRPAFPEMVCPVLHIVRIAGDHIHPLVLQYLLAEA